MNQFIAMFLPAIFATYTNEKLVKKEIEYKEWIQRYLMFTLLINIINFAIVIFIIKNKDFIFTNIFTLKYLLLSIVIGSILSLIISFIEKNMEISIRVDKNEK